MNHLLPLRVEEEPKTPDEMLAVALRRLLRVLVLAEGAESSLDLFQGLEIDRDEMLELFGMVSEECSHAMRLLRQVAAGLQTGGPA